VPSISKTATRIRRERERRGVVAHVLSLLTNLAALSALAVVLIVAIALIALVVAFAQSRYNPRPMIVVQPFEASADASKSCGMTGKNAEDLFVDRVNELVNDAVAFHGNANSSRDAMGKVPELPQIPIETTYGISVQGISIDNLMNLYNHRRYDVWTVSGDVLYESGNCHAQVRLTKTAGSSGWDVAGSRGEMFSDVIRRAALKLMSSAHPELAGRALLQEAMAQRSGSAARDASLAVAESSFRSWIQARPADETAYFYLLTAFFYQGKNHESLLVSRWLQQLPSLRDQVATDEKAELQANQAIPKVSGAVCLPVKKGEESSVDKIEMLSALAEVSPDPRPAPDQMAQMTEGLNRLACLSERFPANQRYMVNSAAASEELGLELQRVAITRPLLPSETVEIEQRFRDALHLLLQAEALDPNNGGTHRSLGFVLKLLTGLGGTSYGRQAVAETELAMHIDPESTVNLRALYGLNLPEAQTGFAANACETMQLMTPEIDDGPDGVCPPRTGAATAMPGPVSTPGTKLALPSPASVPKKPSHELPDVQARTQAGKKA
jgi:hypothetical protein